MGHPDVAHMTADHRDALRLYATALLGLPDGDWTTTGADPEGIDAFEWGLEISALAAPVSATPTFFFYHYHNYQAFRLTSTPAARAVTASSA